MNSLPSLDNDLPYSKKYEPLIFRYCDMMCLVSEETSSSVKKFSEFNSIVPNSIPRGVGSIYMQSATTMGDIIYNRQFFCSRHIKSNVLYLQNVPYVPYAHCTYSVHSTFFATPKRNTEVSMCRYSS